MLETIVMPVDLRPTKAVLRERHRDQRNALTPAEVHEKSAAITRFVTALPIFMSAATVCAYMAFGNEAATIPLIEAALARGARVALPRTLRGERQLLLHAVNDLMQLVPGPYGILEPPASAPLVDPADVELFLVPGTVFDTAGNRIGYGAGYYDSLLVMSQGWRVGLAYAMQLAPHVPTAEHDMPMDLIATEVGLIDCARGQQASDRLRLRNMLFHGHHGAFPEERAQGIRLAVDLDLRLDLQLPGLTDDLTTTVDYPAVYRLIDRVQSEREFSLFEALVEQMALAVLQEFPIVAKVTIAARKFHPPIGGLMDSFEVEISRSRPLWMRPHGV